MILAGALLPAPAAAQKVSYDYNRTATFTGVRTYAIRPGDKMSENPRVNDRITQAIAGTLATRGMSASSNPDVYVVPSMSTEIRREITGYGPGWFEPFGYGYYTSRWYGPWGYGAGSYEVRDVEYATLTIDMIDARTGSLLWRGKGVRSVNPQWKPETVDRKVFKAVTKIFKNFPPGRDDD
jgi:hypothetical protein